MLVGTTSIETSEYLSGLLKRQDIRHEVLNAKFHEREAEIVAQAGRPGAVTIATNMAGRGTDIVLGGNLEAERCRLEAPTEEMLAALEQDWSERHNKVIESGGLHIIGTERHESRRIDNQLRGRSGRQGDPGSSRFYLSLEDNLMRIFGDPERIKRLLSRAGMKAGEAIESKLLSRQIERAQRKVEAHNFDIRKQLLEYDDVANDQRKVVYQQRAELMDAGTSATRSARFARRSSTRWSRSTCRPKAPRRCGTRTASARRSTASSACTSTWPGLLEQDHTLDENRAARPDRRRSGRRVREEDRPRSGRSSCTRSRRRSCSASSTRTGRSTSAALDYLRQGIHLRGYAQRNPKQEYKREAFEMFSGMLERVKHDTISILSKIQIRRPEDVAADRAGDARPAHAPVPARGRAVVRRAAAGSSATRVDAAARRGRRCGRRRRKRSRSHRTCASSRRSGATRRARAVPVRSSSSATAVSADVSGASRCTCSSA